MKRLLLSLIVTVSVSAQTIEVAPSTPAARSLQAQLAGADAQVRDTYAPIGYRLLWTRNGQPTPQAQALLAEMKSADA